MSQGTTPHQQSDILHPFHSVLLDADLCVGCTTCIKFCPTKAIRVRNGKAHISEDRCIDCGECIRRCPKGAKKAVSDPLVIMDAYDIKVALPAPSLYAQFGTKYPHEEIFNAIYSAGFDEVFDVAWGALVVTTMTHRILAEGGPRPRISSACPVVVRLIQQRFPGLISHLMPILPPCEIAAREARRMLGTSSQKAGIFFISPCTAKVTAVRSPLGYEQSAIDAVFSFGDIFAIMKRTLEHPSSSATPHRPITPSLSIMDHLEPGMGWARSDGELEALHIENAVSVDGISNVIDLFEAIENGNIDSTDYIEARACPGGRGGGPTAVENPHIARSTMRQRFQQRPSIAQPPKPGRNPEQLSLKNFSWTKPLAPNPVLVLDRDLSKALEMAEKIEQIRGQLPGIDCGACGAPDCDSFAEDIVRGLSTIEECRLLDEYSKNHVKK